MFGGDDFIFQDDYACYHKMEDVKSPLKETHIDNATACDVSQS